MLLLSPSRGLHRQVQYKAAHVRTVCRAGINNLYQVGILEESLTATDITLPSPMDPPRQAVGEGWGHQAF